MPLWRVITGLGITQIIGWGTIYYALGALSASIRAETGWSETIVFGSFTLSLLVSGLVSRLAGRAIDQRGGRQIMVLGSAVAAVGCAVLAFAGLPLIYLAGWLILGVAMRLCTYDAAFTALSQIAGEKTRLSISYLSLFGGLASTVFWPLGHYLAGQVGWQNCFLIYAGLHLFVCAPIHYVMLADAKPLPPKPIHEQTAGLEGPDRKLVMALFALVLAANGFVFAAISANVLPLFAGLGLQAAAAISFAALIGPSQVFSRIIEIMFGRKLTATHLSVVAFGLLPLGLVVMIMGQFSAAAVLLFVVLYGMSNGLVTIAKGAYTLAIFGQRNYGETIGRITTPSLILNAMAPLIMAYVMKSLGAEAAIIMCVAFGLISIAAMAWLARRFPG